ncbi:ExbD/TolR family protein [Sphaerotilus hippei]|nr:biopolymer transporter ExbD [Sphaerotilus hippei]
MKFRRAPVDEPEINLIPFIDVLLVVLIFLMLSTTYSRYTELKVNLPVADAEVAKTQTREIVLAVAADGRYSVNGTLVQGSGIDPLVTVLREATGGDTALPLIISADAMAAHQSVINAMDAARRVGLHQLTFATQQGRGGNRH